MRILYDTIWSTRGVLQAVGRKPRAKDPFDFQVGPLWETLPDMHCKISGSDLQGWDISVTSCLALPSGQH